MIYLIEVVKNIYFRTVQNQLQRTLKSDIKLIQQSSHTLTPADKTSNMYRLTKEECNKMRRNATTSIYKKANKNIKKIIKKEKKLLKSHSTTLLTGWTLTPSPSSKYYKENFLNHPKVRLSTQSRMNLEE